MLLSTKTDGEQNTTEDFPPCHLKWYNGERGPDEINLSQDAVSHPQDTDQQKPSPWTRRVRGPSGQGVGGRLPCASANASGFTCRAHCARCHHLAAAENQVRTRGLLSAPRPRASRNSKDGSLHHAEALEDVCARVRAPGTEFARHRP